MKLKILHIYEFHLSIETNQAESMEIILTHHSEIVSVPRLGMHSATIDDKAFAQITSYGIELVKQGTLCFEPIRMTEGWLLGLGCRKLNHELWKCRELDCFLKLGNSGLEFVNRNVDIIVHVHEFQNYFYDLTGKRLELENYFNKSTQKWQKIIGGEETE